MIYLFTKTGKCENDDNTIVFWRISNQISQNFGRQQWLFGEMRLLAGEKAADRFG